MTLNDKALPLVGHTVEILLAEGETLPVQKLNGVGPDGLRAGDQLLRWDDLADLTEAVEPVEPLDDTVEGELMEAIVEMDAEP
jgi:L-fucose mutarotase/ribose pyranase (RbsD/FucU family)